MKDKRLPKLVRDKIPQIITESGRNFKAYVADSPEYNKRIVEKMKEEVEEFFENPSIEEAADVFQVYLTILENWNLSREEVELAAARKVSSHGAFHRGIVLEEVH